jgi:hypothetical protein
MDAAKSNAFASRFGTPGHFREVLIVETKHGLRRLGGILADFQRRALEPLDEAVMALADVRQPKHPRQYLEMTKGTAKTTLVAINLLYLLLASSRPIEGRIGAGDQLQASEALSVLRSLLLHNQWLSELIEVQTRLIRRLDGLGQLVVLATDDKTKHGGRPNVTFVDELVNIGDGEGEGFVDSLIMDQTKLGGLLLVCSNAGIKKSWQEKRRNEWIASPLWTHFIHSDPAPWISEQEIDATGISQSRKRRFYFGIWTTSTDLGLRDSDVEAAVRLPGPIWELEPGWAIAFGIDLGVEKDAAAIAVARKKGRHCQVINCRKWLPTRGQRVSLDAVEEEIVRLYRLYSPRYIVMDPSQGRQMFEHLQKLGLPVEFQGLGPKVQDEMAALIFDLFASSAIDLFRSDDLVNDFLRMEIEDRPRHGLKLVPKKGRDGHGDVGISSVYALYRLKDEMDCGPIEVPETDPRAESEVYKLIKAGIFHADPGDGIFVPDKYRGFHEA